MIVVRPFELERIEFGLQLSVEAGWNQRHEDWRRALALDPAAAFLATLDGVDAGAVTACQFGHVAWVALMLVRPAARRQGVGRALMVRVLQELDRRQVASVRLDATPLGRPLYEQLGFRVDFTLQRYGGVVAERIGEAVRAEAADERLEIRPLEESDWPAVLACDRRATGADRSTLLRRLVAELPAGAWVARSRARTVGFRLLRAGRVATQIGPCSGEPAAAAALLDHALRSQAARPVFLDLPDSHAAAVAVALRNGLAPLRPLARMTRGEPVNESVEHLWASSGPEKG